MGKKLRAKELPDRDTQSVAQLFYGGNGGAVVSAADNVVDGGLRYAAEAAEPVDGQAVLPAQLQDTLSDCFADIHALTSVTFCFQYRTSCRYLQEKIDAGRKKRL